MSTTNRIGKNRYAHLRIVVSASLVGAMLVAAFLWLAGSFSGVAIAQDSGGGLVFNTPTPSADDGDNGDDNNPDLEEVEDADDSNGTTNQPGDDEAQQASADEISFGAGDWIGGYLRDDSASYGRPWTSLYGAESDFYAATLYFTLSDDPEAPILLTFDGLDDEEPGNNPIAVEINGQRIFEGDSWFESWDGAGNGENAAWTTVRFSIPPELLVAGTNTVTFFNLSDAANFSSPPYILLAEGTISSSESGIFGDPGDIDFKVDVLGTGN
jgi:hypothetical protein